MNKYPGGRFGVLHGNAGDFGVYYTGSTKAKQAAVKKKKLNKQKK